MTRTAVVTGAARGIGLAIADRLRADGMRVIGVDILPGDACLLCDLGDPEALEVLLVSLEQGDPIDVLVNNAAVQPHTPPDALTHDELRVTLAVDLEAPTLLAARLGTLMARRGWGRIVSISSIHGQLGERGALAYDIAKSGLNQATRTLAVEWGRHGVLVNAVAPGFVDTKMAQGAGESEFDKEWFRTGFLEHGRLPVGRAAKPVEIAAIVSWLVGDENTYLSGQVLTVDGGLTVTL